MELSFELRENVGVLKVSGRLDAYNSTEFKESFTKYTEQTVNFVLDLSNLDFLDSTGLGSLVACLKAISEKDGDIRIANMSEKPRMVFEITRAYKIFEIFDDVDVAIMSYEAD
ncbi:STAS domain-containing protein [bacterium]|nr:STAS domain-containing protein [bacterium]